MKFALTGATGLLGRNLLLEIIKRNHRKLGDIEIVIFGRDSTQKEIKKRIIDILVSELGQYLKGTNLNQEHLLEFAEQNLICINTHLDKENLSISPKTLKTLKDKHIDYFFHIASLTDFRSTEEVTKKLEKTNISGTERILDLVAQMKVQKFIYVSSAYVCGTTTGKIMPDYVNLNQSFHNSYEISKLKAEILVRNFHKETGICCQIFRPSTLCGRLIESPIGATPKFDVFYSWAAFFLRYKQKMLSKFECINDPFEVDLRFCVSEKSGLNIVSADYAAKTMYEISVSNEQPGSFHLASTNELLHKTYFSQMLSTLNIQGIKFVDQIPTNLNNFEKFYYKTVGEIFTPYITSEPMLFDISNTHALGIGNEVFNLSDQNFKELMTYSKKHYFGL